MDNSQLLLQEFRSFRDTEFREFREAVNEWQCDSAQRLTKLEAEVKAGVIGNGTPSRLSVVECKINTLERWRWYTYGFIVATSSAITIAVRYILGR
jgi:hypothetical protein